MLDNKHPQVDLEITEKHWFLKTISITAFKTIKRYRLNEDRKN